MAAEDPSGEVVSTEEQCPDCSASERSFDQLAKGLASGTVSRRKALRMLGAVLVGGTLASVPGAAWAAKCKPLLEKCSANRQCCSKNCIKNPRGRGRICGCPTGQTLCPANNSCVQNCPSGQALDPTTCQCTQCQNASECPTPDSECQRATCTNGVCGVENLPNGTPCDDLNPCTTNDVCTTGVCAGTLTEGCVQCQADSECASVPVDQCHRAVCGTEGFCVVESRPDGTSCDDGNPCTENDQCTAGVCSGTQIQGCVRCQNNADCSGINVDQCHEAVCNQAGVCEVQNKADGTPCNDAHACTDNDVCTAGVCAGTLREDCVECSGNNDCASVPVDQCHRAVCGAQGFCIVENEPDNTACDDNNSCTENDVCTAGVCAGTPVAGCVPCQTATDCSGGKTCQGGRCVCPQGQTECGGVCKDLATDVANCGTCGNVCATGLSCLDGQCICPTGTTLCGEQCVPSCTGGHVLNPTTCQCECPIGASLINGECVCPTGTTPCGRECVSNSACASSGGTFNPTTCQCENCPSGTISCGGNASFNPPRCVNPTCIGGNFNPTTCNCECAPGFTGCNYTFTGQDGPKICCPATCTNIAPDDLCSGASRTCGTTLEGGTPVCVAACNSGRCGCTSSSQCSPGFICVIEQGSTGCCKFATC